jgi:hypothetical protein
MDAVRLGSDLRMAVVDATSQFLTPDKPRRPQELDQPQLYQSSPADPWQSLRLATQEEWGSLNVRVGVKFDFNDTGASVNAALKGLWPGV